MLTAYDEPGAPAPVDLGFGEAVITDDGQGRQTVIYRYCDMVVYIDTTADSVGYAQALNALIGPLFCSE